MTKIKLVLIEARCSGRFREETAQLAGMTHTSAGNWDNKSGSGSAYGDTNCGPYSSQTGFGFSPFDVAVFSHSNQRFPGRRLRP